MDGVHEARRTVLTLLPDTRATRLDAVLLELRAECEAAMRTMGAPVGSYELHTFADLRYEGQSYELTAPFDPDRPALARQAFEQQHAARYGFTLPDRSVELVNLRLRAVALHPKPAGACWEPPDMTLGDLPSAVRLTLHGETAQVPVILRAALQPNTPIPAPALIVQPDSTLLIEPGWEVFVDSRTGALIGRTVS
jgi:N-methylhydantoinase A/oxoprolinase/acetone carboxylase beta subunit